MDEINKKWKRFLLEGKQIPYQIYCDMDGVLVDLLGGIEEAVLFEDIDDSVRAAAIQALQSGELWSDLARKDTKYPELSLGVKEIFKVISEDASLWANLPGRSAGGIAIQHTSAGSTIEELKKIVGFNN